MSKRALSGEQLELLGFKAEGELWRVSGPRITAGALIHGGRVVEAAPVLRWSLGMSGTVLERWCQKNGFKFELVPTSTDST